jgi:hypothetical protein
MELPEWETGEVQTINVDRGLSCAIDENRSLKIVDSKSWQSMWQEMNSKKHPPPSLPVIDFNTSIVFAVFLGDRGTGGFTVDVTAVMISEWRYDVYAVESQPGPNCFTTQAITQPYHIVKITDYPWYLPVWFHYNVTIHDCP